MMPAAAGQKVPIIKPQVESLFQRFNMMHRQLLIQPRHSEDTVASLIANPAKMEVTPYDLFPLFLPVCVLRNPDVLLLRCFACFGFLGQMYPLGWIRPQYLHDFSI